VDIDFLKSCSGFTRGIALLYHGLESTTSAPLTVREAFALTAQGFDVVYHIPPRLNFLRDLALS
jgi:hypothetical protein